MAAVIRAFMGTGADYGRNQPLQSILKKPSTGEPKQIIIRGKAQLQEFLTCKFCLSRYSPSADGKKLPRELDCDHVFCQECLTNCIRKDKHKHWITCPTCKQKTTLAGANVLCLPVNRQMLGLLKRIGDDGSSADRESHAHKRDSSSRDKAESRDSGRASAQTKVLKSALKKPGGANPNRSSNQAGIKQTPRLSSSSTGSAVRPGGVTGEDTGSFIAEAEVAENCGEELIEELELEGVAPSSPSARYPVGELNDLAPPGFMEDIRTTEAGEEEVDLEGVFGGVDYLGSLRDLLHLQPTCAAYMSTFGKFNEEQCVPGQFCTPTKISCSKENQLAIVDPGHDSVQVFSPNGECVSLFKVKYLTGVCFVNETTLAVSSGRGVELYGIKGKLICTIPLGKTKAVARYQNGGFVAALDTYLAVASNPTTSVKVHKITGARADIPGLSKEERTRPFKNITDVAVGSSDEFIVLDENSVVVLDYNGQLLTTIDPGALLANDLSAEVTEAVIKHGSRLFQPYAVASDPTTGQIVVSDSVNRYISAFAMPGGGFVRCLVNLRDQVENENIRAYGVTVNSASQLFIVLRDYDIAETAFYSI